MLLPLAPLLLIAAAPQKPPAAVPTALPTLNEVKMRDCLTLAETDPPSAIIFAGEWQKNKGGYLAQACLASAYDEQNQPAKSAAQFAAAAAAAQLAKDKAEFALWAKAGQAALAASDAAQAEQHLTKALTGAAIPRPIRGDMLLYRARAYVANGKPEPAAKDLNEARTLMPNDPQAWLLSATLARRSGALNEAQGFIKTAAQLSPSDASIALEAGNIAAAAGVDDIAREQWQQTIRIAPQSPQADTARRLLDKLAASGPGDAKPAAAINTGSAQAKVAEPETR